MIDTENFAADVIEKSFTKPILVDFWAEWCGPCKVLGPVLERLEEKYNGLFELVKLNTDYFPELASQYGVRGIPNVKLFVDGEVKAEFTGALPESQADEWIRKNIPGRNDKAVEQAKHFIMSGKVQDALKLLNEIKEKEPGNKQVDLLFAQLYLFDDPAKAVSLLKGAEEWSDDTEIVNAINTIADLLIRMDNRGFPDGEAKTEYLRSVEFLKDKNFSKALEGFISIIRMDRSYDDDGSRKACIAIFKYLGEENQVTLNYRRDFGSALYV